MSPTPLAADLQPDRQLKILARAFEALLLTTQRLAQKEQFLHQRLQYAHDEYLKLAEQLPGGIDSHTKIVSEKILSRRLQFDCPRKQSLDALDVVKDLAESGNVGDSSLSAINDGVGLYKPLLNREADVSLTGMVATRAGSLERDFTTKGTRGSLRCPFTKSRHTSENGVNGIEAALPVTNGDTCAYQHLDPIKEEQLERRSSQAPSGRSSSARCPASRCPIRFLDQHSPEEIADYVERHKHEIPRSHAICVKRYSGSSRQMDAKYGDLTNMIRGLSEKHQAFLPPGQHARTASSSVGRVEKWAEEVNQNSTPPTVEDETLASTEPNDEDRASHFDRPMREVRVGESPSRPWGIHVPVSSAPVFDSAIQSSSVPDKSTDYPARDEPKAGPPKAGRCPFGHGGGAPSPDHPAIDTETVRNDEPDTPNEGDQGDERQADAPPKASAATIVFNGPVFFGFSPEQTATFMQQLAAMGGNKI
ncbi:hypothetical protein ASPCAL09910 [Aspergillus calidoustus]|uniref:Uncharacterized protein n=1 Tax=Aspergillus calidoustus TaxID=454130 RepID=A0A0U5G3W0_ASPCI|nr:hypothetical protein ASPCAL09910 [Aspergillus calidoustus]